MIATKHNLFKHGLLALLAVSSLSLSSIAYAQDADGDGIDNIYDLDDDNDGILDTHECTLDSFQWVGQFTNGQNIRPYDENNKYQTTIDDVDIEFWSQVYGSPTVRSINAINWIGQLATPFEEGYRVQTAAAGDNWETNYVAMHMDFIGRPAEYLTFRLYDLEKNTTFTERFVVEATKPDGTIHNLTPADYTISTGGSKPPKYVGNNTFEGVYQDDSTANDYAEIHLSVPVKKLKVSFKAEGTVGVVTVAIGNISFLTQCEDFDGDGIPNYLDLDSDNDGCLDAIEGGASFSTSDLDNATGVTVGTGSSATNQNLGNTVDANGVPTVASDGQSIGQSQVAAEMTVTQPTDQTVYVGDNAVFLAPSTAYKTSTFNAGTPDYSAQTPADNITYQWYRSTDNGTTWTAIDTTENLTLNAVTLANNGWQFKREMTCDQNGCALETNVVTLTVVQVALNATKSVQLNDSNSDGYPNAGETLSYTFEIENTGTVALQNLSINDPVLGGTVTCDPAITSIAVGTTATCNAAETYTLTQADIDSGQKTNTATVSGNDGTGSTNPKASASAMPSVTMTLKANPQYNMVKSVDKTTIDAPTTLNYTFTFTNSGNVTLSNLNVTDPNASGLSGCPIATLAGGATATCTATKTVTQDDIDSGTNIVNTATATATTSNGNSVNESDTSDNTATTTINRMPTFTLDKTAGDVVDANGNGYTDAGDTIAYSFAVSNTGNVSINVTGVSDAKLPNLSCDATTLAVGDSNIALTCSNNVYTLTDADITALSVENTATATGTDPDGKEITAQSTATTPLTATATFTLDKTAGDVVDANGNGYTDAGDTIAYSFAVSNTGNVAINVTSVSDAKLPDLSCDATTLAVGDSDIALTCSNNVYTLTDADITALSVENTATATGTDPDGGTVTTDPSTATTPLTATAAFTLDKTAGDVVDANGNGYTDAGDTIAYSFAVSNTGNVAINVTGVSDAKLPDLSCDATTLAVGDSDIALTCSNNVYTLTDANITALSVENTATATGTDPDGGTVTTDPSTVTTTFDGTLPPFDPPSGKKTYNADGIPVLEWKQVWINPNATTNPAMTVKIVDSIPANSTYVDGSITCEARGNSTQTRCEFDTATQQVVFEGIMAADGNATTEADAQHEVVITFQVNVINLSQAVSNQAEASYDSDNDGTLDDTALSDDPSTGQATDPTVWRPEATEPAKVNALNAIGLMLMLFSVFAAAYRRRMV